MDRPLRPDGGGLATTLPARPGPGGRPGIGERPGLGGRPGPGDRPIVGDRPNLGDRDRWSHNNVINSRPAWINIDNSTNLNISRRWNNAFTRPGQPGWWGRPANRLGYWHGWADGVRGSWRHYHHHAGWFDGAWWSGHYCPIGGWHYHFWAHSHPWRYWWTVPVWSSVTRWFTWSAPAAVWSQPVYYDYGTGGNVVYQDNSVYIGGEQVATADEFAQSAMTLATVPPPESEEQSAQSEWLPLGTFAISTGEKDKEPNRVVQLAVNKQGIVSGTLYNTETDQAQAVQGQVDKATQRVAFRVGESETLVAETGLYNLTQNEAPLLVHFGTERVEHWLLIRLEAPPEESAPQP